MKQDIINIGSRKEVFWDDFMLDTALTTAEQRLVPPVEKECSFVFDSKEEYHSVSYPNIIKDEHGYKLYYLSFNPAMRPSRPKMRMLESQDGIHWTRPELNIYPSDEPGYNNIVFDDFEHSALCVFYDTNPDCPPDEKYKVLTQSVLNLDEMHFALWCHTSPDGYHFKKGRILSEKGLFDSLNATFYSNKDKKYYSFIRNFHRDSANKIVRDVRLMTSEDFVHWTDPVSLEYDNEIDYQMYTSNITLYPDAPHIFIGMPTRYVERTEWTQNVDQFGSAEIKRAAAKAIEQRCGVAVTDLVFMCSRDGLHFHRYQQAYLTPGLETAHNWIYGDCYASYPIIDTGDVFSFYLYKNGMSPNLPNLLYRYEVRKDGFACRVADGTEKVVVTKPFLFTGSSLHLNMATSALGSIYVEVLDENGELLKEASIEIYGDSLDREVCFADGSDFSAFAGRPIRLRFRMADAKLFAMYFK